MVVIVKAEIIMRHLLNIVTRGIVKNVTLGPTEGLVLFSLWQNRPCGSTKRETVQWKEV